MKDIINKEDIFGDKYIGLYKMITLFCIYTLDDDFYELSEKLEDIFYRYIQYEKEHFGAC